MFHWCVLAWMDNEMIFAMDAVVRHVHGELVVNYAAIIQYVCLSSREQHLRQPSSHPWSMPGTIRLRHDCSVWAHTDCQNAWVWWCIHCCLLAGLLVILFAWKKTNFVYWKLLWGWNVQNGQSLHDVVLLFWRLNINLDSNNYSVLDILYVVEIKYWAWLNLCLYRRRTFHTSGWWFDKVTTLLMRASAL